jgi:CheY-like chemotaxis protein
MSILIVEDHKTLRETFQDVLRQSGYQVRAAANGRAALARIGKSRPSIVFVELTLPGMSGLEFIHALRANPAYSTIPVVAMAARGDTGVPTDTGQNVTIVCKPFSTQTAIHLIEAHAAKSTSQKRGRRARAIAH